MVFGDGVSVTEEVDSPPARDKARSISSCVRFLDWRNSTRFSSGEEATEGSRRTVTPGGEVRSRPGIDRIELARDHTYR